MDPSRTLSGIRGLVAVLFPWGEGVVREEVDQGVVVGGRPANGNGVADTAGGGGGKGHGAWITTSSHGSAVGCTPPPTPAGGGDGASVQSGSRGSSVGWMPPPPPPPTADGWDGPAAPLPPSRTGS